MDYPTLVSLICMLRLLAALWLVFVEKRSVTF